MFLSKVDLALPVSKVHFDLTSVLTTLAQNAIIMETKGLTRCLLSETTTKTGEKETVLNTEGINMNEIFNHSDVSTHCQSGHYILIHTDTRCKMALHCGSNSHYLKAPYKANFTSI